MIATLYTCTVGQALDALLASPLWLVASGAIVIGLFLAGAAALAIRWSEER
jgi:hypothetical protein